MRIQSDMRKIKVKKSELIKTIKEHKAEHITEYKDAKVAYKKEALNQLADLKKKIEGGATTIKLDLISPIDREDNFEKLITMFEWDVDEEVELTQGEFNEYVHNETSFSSAAKFANMSYTG